MDDATPLRGYIIISSIQSTVIFASQSVYLDGHTLGLGICVGIILEVKQLENTWHENTYNLNERLTCNKKIANILFTSIVAFVLLHSSC